MRRLQSPAERALWMSKGNFGKRYGPRKCDVDGSELSLTLADSEVDCTPETSSATVQISLTKLTII